MMNYSTWMRRNTDPLSSDFLGRRTRLAPLMPIAHRLGSAWAGHREGRKNLPDAMDANGNAYSTVDTFWLARNRESFREADQRALLRVEARVAAPSRELFALVTLGDQQRELLALARAEREILAARPKPDATTVKRGPAEQGAPDSVVVARRMRTWEQPLTVADAHIAGLAASIVRVDTEAADLHALVSLAHTVALTHSADLRAYYQRRSNIYLRALTRAHLHGGLLQALGTAAAQIPAPQWTLVPSAWIPAGYVPATTTTNTTGETN